MINVNFVICSRLLCADQGVYDSSKEKNFCYFSNLLQEFDLTVPKMNVSGMSPVEKMFVSSSDFGGPVPSVLTKEPDYWLAIAWIVVMGGVALLVTKSTGWKSLVEMVQSAWTEAQAHHDHAE